LVELFSKVGATWVRRGFDVVWHGFDVVFVFLTWFGHPYSFLFQKNKYCSDLFEKYSFGWTFCKIGQLEVHFYFWGFKILNFWSLKMTK
jgi:hypothetical protein